MSAVAKRGVVAAIGWVLLFCILTLSPMASSAGAAPPVHQGWWKQTLSIGTLDLLSLLDPSTLDVPPDGLYIAGGTSADKPRAFAAVTYDLGGAQVDGPLRLETHPLAVSVPTSGAMACPLDRPTFAPAQGGSITTAPAYDCLGAVTATIDDSGAYLFDVRTLVRGGVVAVAILPTTQTSRIVFAAPPDGSLPVRAAAPVAPPVTTEPPPDGDAAPSPTDASRFAPSLPNSVATSPSADIAPRVNAPAVSVARASDGAAGPEGSLGRAYTLLALAALAGGAWVFAGREREGERSGAAVA